MNKLKIGGVTIDSPVILAPMAGYGPAVSFALQKKRGGASVHGNGQRQSSLL